MSKDLNGAQVGMSPVNNVNNPRPNTVRGRNEFPQTYKHLTTDRYGEMNLFYWAKCERGDVQNLHTIHDLHTFTMKSPMVMDVNMTKSFIKVPMQAIYPRTWEKQFTIPTQGDDIPDDSRALLNITSLVERVYDVFNSHNSLDVDIQAVFLLEAICSEGSLFSRCNQHFNFRFNSVALDESYLSIDKWFDLYFAPRLKEKVELNGFWSTSGKFYFLDDTLKTKGSVSFRRFLEMARRSEIDWYTTIDSGDWDALFEDELLTRTPGVGYNNFIGRDGYINIEPIIAYQLACAQFCSNDFVDFIYSAQLYRDNLQSIFMDDSTRPMPTFLYNGVDYQYDVFSQRVFDFLLDDLYDENYSVVFPFFMNLFSYVPSLRYGDYFTGAKPRPLAVGEFSAQVNSNQVSAIDITRSIQMQRLLNRVNMVGRKLGDYLTGIFGGKLPEAPKDVPVFLAHQRFDVKGFETQNTSDAQLDPSVQNTITSHLRTSDNRLAFEIEIDEPCYLIGLNSYESMRIYSKTIDRFAFHHDRYDDFIPEMQYIGDQDIKSNEIGYFDVDAREPFGYCLRYMEYKQRYSYASGGFIENLPSWSFITDNNDGNKPSAFISPDYIRSSPSEFDRFYKSLTGYSLASYFHFIVAHTNVTSPSRMMDYTPEILK